MNSSHTLRTNRSRFFDNCKSQWRLKESLRGVSHLPGDAEMLTASPDSTESTRYTTNRPDTCHDSCYSQGVAALVVVAVEGDGHILGADVGQLEVLRGQAAVEREAHGPAVRVLVVDGAAVAERAAVVVVVRQVVHLRDMHPFSSELHSHMNRHLKNSRSYGPTVVERLARSPPTKANRVQSPAGSPGFRKWESCRRVFSRIKWTYRPACLHQDDPGSIYGFSHVGIVVDDTVGRRVFSAISHFLRPFIPALLPTHLNHPHRLERLLHGIKLAGYRTHLLLVVVGEDGVQGEGHASSLALGQQQAVRVAAVAHVLPQQPHTLTLLTLMDVLPLMAFSTFATNSLVVSRSGMVTLDSLDFLWITVLPAFTNTHTHTHTHKITTEIRPLFNNTLHDVRMKSRPTFSDELVDLDEVVPLVAERDLLAEPVVLGSEEDAYGGQRLAVTLRRHVDGEGLVVEAAHAGLDLDVVQVDGVVQRVQQVHVEVLEVRLQRVDGQVSDLHSRQQQLSKPTTCSHQTLQVNPNSLATYVFLSVGRQQVLVQFEEVVDVLVQSEEGRISGRRGEQACVTHVELALGVGDLAEQDVSVVVQRPVVVAVLGRRGRLHYLAQGVDARRVVQGEILARHLHTTPHSASSHSVVVDEGGSITHGDDSLVRYGLAHSPLVVDHVLHLDGAQVLELEVVGARGELSSHAVRRLRVEAVHNVLCPAQGLHGRQVVGQPLQVEPATLACCTTTSALKQLQCRGNSLHILTRVSSAHLPGDELVVHVVEELSLPVLVDAVLFRLPPEGEVHVPVSVVRVHAQVLTQVRHTLLGVADRACQHTHTTLGQSRDDHLQDTGDIDVAIPALRLIHKLKTKWSSFCLLRMFSTLTCRTIRIAKVALSTAMYMFPNFGERRVATVVQFYLYGLDFVLAALSDTHVLGAKTVEGENEVEYSCELRSSCSPCSSLGLLFCQQHYKTQRGQDF
ncbi:hypothetical protein PR048_006617, partial [Dryococelus australis]